ncbi:MAG: phosphodiesterase [Woeseiaceae bacterium]
MTKLTTSNRPPPDEDQGLSERDMALVLSGDGSICSVLHSSSDIAPNESIDALWPGRFCERIRSNLHRALRNRQLFSEELEEEGSSTEFTYITQGRDRVLLVARDTSKHRKALTRLRHLAFVDEVTTLPNKEYLLRELQKIVEHQGLREGRAAVICCHIDDLDAAHGGFGVPGRDTILQEQGVRLIHELRGANALDGSDYDRRSIVARVDYQRFGIVLPAIETGSDAESVAERLMQCLQQPVSINGKVHRLQTFGGISLFPQDGADAETLFENANAATEEARSGQSGEVVFHSGTVKLRTLQRQDLEAELQSALDRGSFALNYLPIIDAATGDVHAIEALLRWPESILGTNSTSKVIGLAERTGLIVPIGEWVLRESFDQLKFWQESGHEDLRLAVNLSMQEFSRQEIAPRLAAMLLQVGVQPSSIELEITEKMLSRDAITGYRVVDALKSLGVRVIVDDFGTGACSLAQLAHSPVDGIKIDNSLVAGIETCEQDGAACAAAIASAHALGLAVAAEGVETEQQASQLRQQGADYLQGFLISRPLTASDMHAFLATARKGGES